MRWELYCRVIDNHGDLGVCWRLARQLGARGDHVRLWVDDASALAWMAPGGATGVVVQPWSEAAPPELGDVVVEAFGAEPPAALRRAMAAMDRPPVWIDLEYLSAEAYVERSHGLPSPQPDGLVRWFFYPGFTPHTGGLLRDDAEPATTFDGRAWLAARGWAAQPHERVVLLFAYAQAPVLDWLPLWASQPTLVLLAPGPAGEALAGASLPAGVRLQRLPWLEQTDFDRALRACDLNAVRGEDSFAQAQLAGRPLLWHIYAQHDGVHAAKLEAWLDRLLEGAEPALAAAVRQTHRAWNGLAPPPATWPDAGAWQRLHRQWRDRLLAQPDLASALSAFARSRPRSGGPEKP
ncbi:MAG: elongation factor P maturation arginine rhamnosyltransferase EarP [Rubrivivax sp.]